MAMTINTNVASINAQRNLSLSGSSLSTSMQRLSSGLHPDSAKTANNEPNDTSFQDMKPP